MISKAALRHILPFICRMFAHYMDTECQETFLETIYEAINHVAIKTPNFFYMC